MAGDNKIFVVDEQESGIRVDKFIASRMPEYSRSEIQKFEISRVIPGRVAPKADANPGSGKDGGSVNIPDPGSSIRLSDKVKPGEEYKVIIPEKKSLSVSCLTSCVSHLLPFVILFEDEHIIVVDKPRGIAMYPGAGRDNGTLVQSILAYTNLSSVGAEGCRPGVVHRIDKDTSGIVVFAKTDGAHRILTRTFASHNIVRKYIAFIWGVPNWESADIKGNIGRSARNRQKMTMLKVGGKPAWTKVDVMNVWSRDGISELRCTLETGRTHQIRVHLSSHGFPVVCDPLYGRGTSRLGSVKNPALLDFLQTHSGQMLHAELLELSHPVTGEQLRFKSRLPKDMRELKEILNG